MGLEKIRFMNGTHLTIEQTESGTRSQPALAFRSLPYRQV
jgi:hypothetical protein